MMRGLKRSTADLFVLFGICLAGTFLPAPPAAAQAITDPLATLQGKWVWIGNRDKLGLAKACAEKWERYEVSADRRQINNSYMAEENGRPTPRAGRGYIVLYEEGSSVVAYLNNENRRYKNGDRWVWVALFENDRNTFFWRIHTLPLDAEDRKFARVRCPPE